MKNILLISLVIFCSFNFVSCQNSGSQDPPFTYHINDNVKNSEEDYFIQIFDSWKAYLNSNYYVRSDSEYWNHETYAYPDFGYVSLLMDMRRKMHAGEKAQCSIVGIVPVENDYYLLKSIFTETNDTTGVVNINFITSVYAKKNEKRYGFFSCTQYFKELYENKKVGNVNYIIHPDHEFDEEAAKKMLKANEKIAKQFEMEPMEFDYVITNDSRDLGDVMGLHLFEYSYQPVASGGMADVYNDIIYAGNNSEYYPHEVVHLYTHAKFSWPSHHWFDEGIAALIGGSTGFDIEWHWEKLRRFIKDNPDYKMDNLQELQKHIPNGEFTTDFRYAVGALICQRIIDKEGMEGVFEALVAGRTDEDYFGVLKQKLNLNREDFGDYVKAEVLKLEPISDEQLEEYRY